MTFPQYRKLKGGLKYYQIVSNTEWNETYFLGKKVITKNHKAIQLPERNFLMDILEFREGAAEEITEAEYYKAIN